VTRLELDDIQGFVVRGYGLPLAAHLFLRVEEAARGRALLADLLPRVVSAAPWADKPDAAVNVAFTYNGLAALGVPEASLDGFPPEFEAGMAASADLLGDAGDSAPEHWEPCFGGTDLLVLVNARDEDVLAEQTARIRGAARTGAGATVVGEQAGAVLAGRREHFGFAAAGAQPALEGSGLPAHPGRGAPRRGGGGWRPIRAGEFLLGYPDEEDVLPPAPPPDAFSRNGSFLVYRKLRQHVGEFRRRFAAADHPGGAELVAAKAVGRWHDGTPLDASPERPDPALAADPARVNAFSYAGDADGLRCPVGAHARRANPRLGLPFEGRLVNRHRMIRRSIPYGDPLPAGAPDDGRDRGLLFMCLQASIARQFEHVQSRWLGDGDAFGLGRDRDPIAGGGTGKLTIPGQPPLLLGPLPPLVTVRGGGYFFVPGITGLRHIARVG
jgi:Dyp-type peroxidase family